MKNCEYFQKVISDIHDDGTELSVEVKEHIKECPHCEEFYALLQSQSRLLGALPEVPGPPAVADKKSLVRRIWDAKVTVPLPAAAVLLLFLGMYLLSTVGRTPLQSADEGQQKNQRPPGIQIIELTPQTAFVSPN